MKSTTPPQWLATGVFDSSAACHLKNVLAFALASSSTEDSTQKINKHQNHLGEADECFANRLNLMPCEMSSCSPSPVLGTVPVKTRPQLLPLKDFAEQLRCTLHNPAEVSGIVLPFCAPTEELHVSSSYESSKTQLP